MAVLTPFGQVLRKLRIEKNITLQELSKKLGNSPAFISAVETGRKAIPDAFAVHVARALDLTQPQIQELRKAADRTRKEAYLTANRSISSPSRPSRKRAELTASVSNARAAEDG